jgi:hypothetical protein
MDMKQAQIVFCYALLLQVIVLFNEAGEEKVKPRWPGALRIDETKIPAHGHAFYADDFLYS